MNKVVTIDEAVSHIKDGMTVMVGDFYLAELLIN